MEPSVHPDPGPDLHGTWGVVVIPLPSVDPGSIDFDPRRHQAWPSCAHEQSHAWLVTLIGQGVSPPVPPASSGYAAALASRTAAARSMIVSALIAPRSEEVRKKDPAAEELDT